VLEPSPLDNPECLAPSLTLFTNAINHEFWFQMRELG
jgi:hypothetical protein